MKSELFKSGFELSQIAAHVVSERTINNVTVMLLYVIVKDHNSTETGIRA